MSSGGKNVIIFLTGAAIGGVCTWLGVKKYYETKADLEVDSVKKAYTEKLAEIEETKSTLDGELEGPKEIDISKTKSHSSIVEQLNNKPDLLDYTKFFKAKGEKLSGVSETIRDAKEDASKDGLSEDELAEMEHPEDDEPYSDEQDEEETLAFEDHQLNGAKNQAIVDDKEPYVIDVSDYELTCGQYDKLELTYHCYDDELEDNGESVDNRWLLIGNAISDSGFDDNDDDILYVRNDKLQSDFKIVKEYSMR